MPQKIRSNFERDDYFVAKDINDDDTLPEVKKNMKEAVGELIEVKFQEDELKNLKKWGSCTLTIHFHLDK